MAVVEAIASVYLDTDVSSVKFSGIPATYLHLEVRYSLALSQQTNSYNRMYFGDDEDGTVDTGSNYAVHPFYGHDTSTSAWSSYNSSHGIYLGQSPGDYNKQWYGPTIVEIKDYANASKDTSVLVTNFDGGTASGADYMIFSSGMWNNPGPVDTIFIDNRYAASFMRGSEFNLYGWKES